MFKKYKFNSIRIKKIFHTLFIIVPIGILGNVIFTVLKTDKEVFVSLDTFNYEYCILALIMGIIPWFTASFRLMIWTRFLGKRISFRNLFNVIIGSEVGSAVTPTAVGGGYAKIGLLMQRGFSIGTSASLTSLNNVEDTLFFVLSMPSAIFITSAFKLPVFKSIAEQAKDSVSFILYLVLGIISFIIIGYGLKQTHLFLKLKKTPFFQKIMDRFNTFKYDFLFVYGFVRKKGKLRFCFTMLLTALHWISRLSVVTALFLCLHLPIHPIKFFLFSYAVYFLAALIPTPGGAVATEASFYLLFSFFIPPSMIGLTTSTWRFLTYYFPLALGSVLFALMNYQMLTKGGHKNNSEKDKAVVSVAAER